MSPTLTSLSIGLLAAAAGLLAWPALEYLIHGVLCHRYRTLVGPFHWGHHRNPHGVFTSPVAWVPLAAIIWVLAALTAGAVLGSLFVLGLLAGFARYEWVHYRFHFREPRSERERMLRAHHLAHHFRNPRMYQGVTTRVFDRAFGTLPAEWREDYARVADRPPLAGPSNLRATYGATGLRSMWAQVADWLPGLRS
ncbi:MAG: sterol desaturase family protein [Myxococcota bacterium]